MFVFLLMKNNYTFSNNIKIKFFSDFFLTLPLGKTLNWGYKKIVLHKGPYSNIREAYAFAFNWIEKNGYTVVGLPRESYIDGIWNKDSEGDWLTEIQVPIE